VRFLGGVLATASREDMPHPSYMFRMCPITVFVDAGMARGMLPVGSEPDIKNLMIQNEVADPVDVASTVRWPEVSEGHDVLDSGLMRSPGGMGFLLGFLVSVLTPLSCQKG